MKIYYYKHPVGNVGDDLNPWLWSRLLPEYFDGEVHHGDECSKNLSESERLFVGIGTILDQAVPQNNLKAIFSSGTGYGKKFIHTNAKYYCVRGPLTADALGLPESTAITDGAALLSRFKFDKPQFKNKFSFMPHHTTAEDNMWQGICASLGISFIDPSGSPEAVISQILASEILITEAMHGAIIADSLRTPWIPVVTHPLILAFKWQDWCMSLNLEYAPLQLPSLWPPHNRFSEIRFGIKRRIAQLAMRNLLRKARPILSEQKIFAEKVERLEIALEVFKDDFKKGMYSKNP